jgi:hypothetical protein
MINSVRLILFCGGITRVAQHPLGGVFFVDIHQVFTDFW